MKFIKSLFKDALSSTISGIILATLSLLIPQVREFFKLIWNLLKELFHWLNNSHDLSGWLILILFVSAFAFYFFILQYFIKSFAQQYIEDKIDGAFWRWNWKNNYISNLTPYCPECDLALEYSENRYDPLVGRFVQPQTRFSCKNCGSVVCTITGGYYDYSINHIKNEIERRVRLKNKN